MIPPDTNDDSLGHNYGQNQTWKGTNYDMKRVKLGSNFESGGLNLWKKQVGNSVKHNFIPSSRHICGSLNQTWGEAMGGKFGKLKGYVFEIFGADLG